MESDLNRVVDLLPGLVWTDVDEEETEYAPQHRGEHPQDLFVRYVSEYGVHPGFRQREGIRRGRTEAELRTYAASAT